MNQEELWCKSQRLRVINYLRDQRLTHGEVGEWPAWDLYPYASIWTVESVKRPGFLGWWAIAGDLPTDYMTCGPERHPRAALRDFATRWAKAAVALAESHNPEGFTIGQPGNKGDLAGPLAARAETLLQWADDDAFWEE